MVESVPLSAAAVVPSQEDGPGTAGHARQDAGEIRELDRGHPFAMVGLRWAGPPPDLVAVRPRRLDGQWGDWITLDPRPSQGGTRAAAQGGDTEPAWLGDSKSLRVRVLRAGAPLPASAVSVVFVDPGARTTEAAPRSTGLALISRAQWGADESIRTRCYQRQGIGVDYAETVRAATIHHTVATNNYRRADSARIVRGVYLYHAITRDWCDIGYNALVDKYGQIFEGRFGGLDLPVWGAHAAGFNLNTVGVALIGTFDRVAAPPAQLEGAAQFLAWKFAGGYRDPNGTVTLVSNYGGSSAKYPKGTAVTLPTIFGHRDVGYTDCPGTEAQRQLPALRARVAALMGNWTTSPIYRKWLATGADAGPLRGVFAVEQGAADGGRRTTFAAGGKTVYWSPGTGAWTVEGGIREKWAAYGSEAGRLGYPVTDELGTPDGIGRFNHFSRVGGSIYWTPATGAHEIEGAIRDRWSRTGWERGPLGYPVTDELGTPDGIGRFNHFSGQHGSIYWTPWTGARIVLGAIKARWAQLGWERSYLGYPVSDEYSVAGGRRSDFQHGYITWHAATGTVVDRTYQRP